MPMPIPVIAQVMPSVSCDGGTSRSISPIAVMMVGDTAAPARNSTSASAGMLSTTSSGRVVSAARPIARTNWVGSDSRGLIAPNTSPTISDPAA